MPKMVYRVGDDSIIIDPLIKWTALANYLLFRGIILIDALIIRWWAPCSAKDLQTWWEYNRYDEGSGNFSNIDRIIIDD